MLIYVDDTGSLAIADVEGFTEEPFCSNGITFGTQQKVQGIPVLVNGSIQPPPLAFDLHKDFIDSPRVTSRTQMTTAAFVQLRVMF